MVVRCQGPEVAKVYMSLGKRRPGNGGLLKVRKMAAAVRKIGRSYHFYRYSSKCEKNIIALSVFYLQRHVMRSAQGSCPSHPKTWLTETL